MKAVVFSLDIKISRDRVKRTVSISQECSVEKIVDKFGLREAYGTQVPMTLDLSLGTVAVGEAPNSLVPRFICLLQQDQISCMQYLSWSNLHRV